MMIRLPIIVTIRVTPIEPSAGSLAMRCLSGRAKWSPESRVLSLKADVNDDEAHDKWLEFFASAPTVFGLEVDHLTGASPEEVSTSCFSKCYEATLEFLSATARPKGSSTTRYYLKTIAEPGDIERLMNQQIVTPESHREMIRRYPITGLVEGWYFRQEEVSEACFVVEASDAYGRKLSRQSVGNPGAAMAECIQFARQVSQVGHKPAEPVAPPNGDPVTWSGSSRAWEEPPSVGR